MICEAPDTGEGITPGAHHYRAFVGATETYDIFSHMQFSLMTLLGLRQEHRLLDIGCGSLRGGKLFLMYLLPDRYFGIEPERWLVEEGIKREVGHELVQRKRPRFLFEKDFPCTEFGVAFDFILAQSIFSHASLAQITQCLAQARAAMTETSIFAASFVEGECDFEGSVWVYPETVRYRSTTIERVASEAGLSCRRLDWFHMGGQTWYLFFVPGLEPRIGVLASLNQAVPLREEVSYYRRRLERLERIEASALYRIAAAVWRGLKHR